MSLVLQSSGGGQITIQEPATASNFTTTLPATTGTLVVTGTTPTLNGITFPATQSQSADANTLDDYEEGTWTPVMTPDGGSITTQSSSGRYTKIGNIVILTGDVTVANWGTANGGTVIQGMPFSIADKFCASGDETAVNGKAIVGRREGAGSTSFNLVYYDNSSPSNTGGNGATFIFSATYRTTQ
jgi:hypothetical protein